MEIILWEHYAASKQTSKQASKQTNKQTKINSVAFGRKRAI
jgi:hypothetical protein